MSTPPLPFPNTASAAAVGPVVPLPTGVRIDRFIIEQTLHQGAHGFAYRVREAGHQQPLALLECFPRALAIRQPDGAVRARQAGDAIALSVVCEAFVQDARALAAIDHPGVVKVYGVINANRTVYRLMPFIVGQTLEEQRLERAEPPTVGGLVRLYDKLLDALEALHKAGFVHGLVQPDQILMKADDNAPVLLGMDGVALELGEMTMNPWAAPEQQQSLRYERVNASADLYMLAATMCFAATGAAPPRAEERLAGEGWDPAALLAQVQLGGGDAPVLRDQLIQAVVASLALAAAARPQRAGDVRHILHPGLGGGDDGFVATTGSAPLWVGEVPDRDSQWETLDGMSGPAPLRDEAETQAVFDPAETARVEAAGFGVPGDPIVERAPVRTPREPTATTEIGAAPASSPAPGAVAGRRAGEAAHASDEARPVAAMPRWLIASVGGAAIGVAALAWWSQRSTSADLPLPAAPAVVQASPPGAPTPAIVKPAPAPSVATAAAPTLPPSPAPAPTPTPTPQAAPAPAAAATPATTMPATATAPQAARAPIAPAAPAPVPEAAVKAPPGAAPSLPPSPTPAATAAVAAAPAVKVAPPPPAPRPVAVAPTPAPRPAATAPKAAPRPAAKTAKASEKTTPAAKPAARASAQARNGTTTASRGAAPETLCGNRTQFSYLYCMQEACARSANRSSAQCVALRRSGDIR